jgi:hypothetical protein
MWIESRREMLRTPMLMRSWEFVFQRHSVSGCLPTSQMVSGVKSSAQSKGFVRRNSFGEDGRHVGRLTRGLLL